MSSPTLRSLPLAARRRLLVRTLLRALLTVVVLVVLYYNLPLDQELDATAVALLLAGLLALTGLISWQVRGILRSSYPALRAVSALSSAIPFFLLIFASAYFLMARAQAGSFTEPLTRTDALYFTVTVFATVGFGDIAPTTQLTRIVTMFQMIADLLVLGVLLRVVLGAVKLGQQRRSGGGADSGAEPPSGSASD
jgi:voltage-gated potassium channel